MERLLDQCLLTDQEFEAGPEVWKTYEDPIPAEMYDDLDKEHKHLHKMDDDENGEWEECLDSDD